MVQVTQQHSLSNNLFQKFMVSTNFDYFLQLIADFPKFANVPRFVRKLDEISQSSVIAPKSESPAFVYRQLST